MLVKIYVESIIINETYGSQADSVKVHKQLVFTTYGIDEKSFKEEMAKISADKESWENFFKKANDYLDDLKKSNTIN